MVSDSAPCSAGPSVRNNKDDIDPSKSYILTLPTELLTMTVENLGQDDMGMVRRTCKTLCNVATLPFARTMPTARRFRFVEEDMDWLIGLTAHPIFGRMLSCISLSTCRLVQVDETRLLKESQRLFRLLLKAAIDMSQFPVKILNLELRGNHRAEIEINKQDLFWLKMRPVPDVRIEITCCEATSVRELSWSKSQIKMTGHNLGPTDELLTECDGGPSWLENEHSQLWDHVYYNKYQEAILTDIFADYDVLECFVRSSAFQHLTIRDCGLSQQEDSFLDGTKSSGITLCRKLKSMASLESLGLEEIWDCSNEEWIQEEPVRWTGQEQIHAGLDNLAARMSGWEWEN
ncbi:hypothetical protein D6D04_09911 [Aureobasidium pullulans]|nr:hypothetical protein D6D04_09911 [Aureobasidium pullulans]